MPPKPPQNSVLHRLWPLGFYRVAGHSMQPAYQPGDTLLGWRWFRRLRPGQVVVAEPDGRPLIKRIARIEPDGRLWLLGDNAGDSADSRHFGPVSRHQLRARIIVRL
jgi:signal peptidase I